MICHHTILNYYNGVSNRKKIISLPCTCLRRFYGPLLKITLLSTKEQSFSVLFCKDILNLKKDVEFNNSDDAYCFDDIL